MRTLWKNIISASLWVIVALLYNFLRICDPLIKEGIQNIGRILLYREELRGHIVGVKWVPSFIITVGIAMKCFYKHAILPLIEIYILKQTIERKMKLPPMRSEESHWYLPHWKTVETWFKIPNEKGVFIYPFPIDPQWDRQRIRIRYLRRSKMVLSVSLVDEEKN